MSETELRRQSRYTWMLIAFTAVVFFLMARQSHAQTNIYWDTSTNSGIGGSATWSASGVNWATNPSGATVSSGGPSNNALFAITNTNSGVNAWASGNYTLNFGGTAGTVTNGGSYQMWGINILTNGYVFTIDGTGANGRSYTLTNSLDLGTNSLTFANGARGTNSFTFGYTASSGWTGGITASNGSAGIVIASTNPLNLTNFGFYISSGGSVSSNAPINILTLSNTRVMLGSQSSGGANFNSAITNNSAGGSPLELTNSSSGTVAFNGVISGSNGLAINNSSSGKITLNASNTYAGGTTVNGTGTGQIQYSNNSAFGSGRITIAGAGTNYIRASASSLDISNAVVINSGSTLRLATTNSGHKTTWSGAISGAGGIYYAYSDTLYLTSTNSSFGGGFNNGSSGALYITSLGMAGANSSLGTNGTITLSSESGTSGAGTVQWLGTTNETSDKIFALSAISSATSQGVKIFAGETNQGGTNVTLTLNGNINSASTNNKVVTLGAYNTNTLIVNGLINQTTNFINSVVIGTSSDGTVGLGNTNNSFGGGVTITNSGASRTTTLIVSSIGSSGNNSSLGTNGTITMGVGSSNATVVLAYTNAGETNNKTINITSTNGTFALDQSGAGNLKFTGAISSATNGNRTIKLQGSTAGTGELASVIGDLGGVISIEKSGTGTWTMSGNNTYSGVTTINGGTLTAGNASALGTNGLTVASGATLSIRAAVSKNNITNNGTVSIGAGGSLTANALASSSGALSLTGTGGNQATLTDSASAGTSSASTVLNVGSVSIGGNATIAFSNSYNNITASGAVNISGTNNIVSIGSSVWDSGNTYNFLTGGSLTASNNSISLSSAAWTIALGNTATNGRTTYLFNTNATSLFMTVGGEVGNITWNGGASGNWTYDTSTTPWTNNANGTASAFYQGDNVTLSTPGSTITVTNTGVTAAMVTNSAASGTVTLTGGTLTNVGLAQSGNGTLLLSNNVVVNGTETVSAGTLTVASGATNSVNSFVLSGGTVSGSGVLTNAAAYDMRSGTANIALSGTNGLNKTTAGTVILGGANAYTGTTTVSAGTLQYGINDAIGSDAVTVAGGTLDIGSYSDTVGVVTLSSGSITGTSGVLSGTSYQVQNGSVSAILGGSGALVKTNAGTVTLSGANTYSGATTITNGALNIQSANALGSTAAGTTVASGAALELQGGITVGAEALTLNGTGVSSGGALRNISGNNTYGGVVTLGSASRINSDAGTLTLNNSSAISGATFGLTLGGAGNLNIASVIGTTTGTLTKDGAGTATLSATNTYSGATTISNGTLAYGVSNAIATGNSVNIFGGTLNLGGFTNTLSSVRFNGGVLTNGTITSSGSIISTNAANTTNTISASIAGGTATNVTFIGITNNANGGVTILSGSNSYTGLTELNGGTTVVGNNYAFGVVGSQSTAGAGGDYTWLRNAALDLNGMSGIVETLVMSNTSGYVTNSASTTATWAGGITLFITASNNFNVGTNGAIDVTGVIRGSAARVMQKNGDGVLILSGANTNQGVININAGTLRMGNAGALGDSTSTNAVNVASGSTLDLNGKTVINAGTSGTNRTFSIAGTGVGGSGAIYNGSSSSATLSNNVTLTNNASVGSVGNLTLSGIIGGTGYGLTKVGAGTLTLSGVNTYTGGTTISNGAISISSSNNVGGGSITLAGTSGGTAQLINTVASGSTNASTSLALGTVTMSGNANLSLANVYTKFDVSSLTLSGSTNQLGIVSTGWGVDQDGATNSYTLLSSVGNITGGNTMSLLFGETSVAIGGTTTLGRNSYQFVYTNNNTYQLNTWGGAWDLVWNGSENSVWNTNSTNWNQEGGSENIAFVTGDDAIFTGLGTTNIVVDAAGVTARTMTVTNNAGALTLSGGNVNAALTVGSGGNLIVEGTITPTGTLTVNGGTLQIGSGGANGALGNTNGISLANAGSFIVNLSTNYTLSNRVTGAGSFTKLGSGTNVLASSNSYTGQTIVGAGTLQIGSATAGGTSATPGSGAIVVSNGATLAFYRTSIYTNANDISGEGSVSQLGTQSLELSGNNTFSGGLYLNTNANGTVWAYANTNLGSGTIYAVSANSKIGLSKGGLTPASASMTIANRLSTSLSGTNTDVLTFQSGSSNTYSITLDGQITGAGWLKIGSSATNNGSGVLGTGTGNLYVNNANNDYTGGTELGNGRIIIGNGLALGTGAILFSSTNLGNTILQITNDTALSQNFTLGSATTNQTAMAVFDISNAVTMSGVISNRASTQIGNVTKVGSGTLTLSGANTYTGGTVVSAGTLAYGAANVLADSGTVTVDNATFNIGSYSDTVAAVVVTNGGRITGTTGILTGSSYASGVVGGTNTISANLAGSGGLTLTGNTNTTVLSGSNTYSGNTDLSDTTSTNMTLRVTSTSSLSANSSLLGSTAISRVPTLDLTAAGNYTMQNFKGGNMIFLATNGDATISFTNTVVTNQMTAGDKSFYATNVDVTFAGALDISPTTGTKDARFFGDGDYTFNGSILTTNNSGTAGLVAATTGRVTLNASNNYNGTTVVSNSATLVLGNNNALGTTNNGTTVASGSTLDLGGRSISGEALAIQGSGVSSEGAIKNSSSTNASWSGTVTFNTNTTVNVTNGGITISGAVGQTVASTLTKNGSGTLTLSGANTYSGGTTINSGTLSLNRAGNTTSQATIVGSIAVNGGTLLLGQANQISDSSAINLGGGTINTGGFADQVGVLTVSANSSISGLVATSGSTSNQFLFSSVDLTSYATSSGSTLNLGSYGYNSTINISSTSYTTWSGYSTTSLNNFANKIEFGNSGLKAQINFNGTSGLTYVTAIPEPKVYVAMAMLVVLVGAAEYRRRRSAKSATA